MKIALKIIDVIVFASIFIVAAQYLETHPNIFDIISVVAMFYIMARVPDVNTVTLVSIILVARIIDSLIFADYQNLNPYFFYSLIAVGNIVMVGIVWARPLLVAKYSPKFLRENKRLTITHQDSFIALLYMAYAILPVIMLIEHIIRHLDDVAFKPTIVYNAYEEINLLLAALSMLVLYFMTFEKSKEARKAREKKETEA